MKTLKIPTLFLFFLWALPLWAVTPMEYYNSLVAGDNEPGFKDGAFDDARFNQPCGLALDEEGKRLFVADKNNNRIRVVYLEENNRVETLTGTGDIKNIDGSLSQAAFNGPCILARLPEDQLAVYESGDHSVRIIDLKNKNVSTLIRGLEDVWNLVFWPLDQCLYLSFPKAGRLDRLELKSKKLIPLLSGDPQVPQPKALCVFNNKLYLSDDTSKFLYQVESIPNTLTAAATIQLIKAGIGNGILQLAASGENLYALQKGSDFLSKILPDYKPVSLATAWGFFPKNSSPYYLSILGYSEDQPLGFAAMPGDQKKLFVSPWFPGVNSIISVKDYDFDIHWAERYPGNDWDYPNHKPDHTFRILIVGNSRVVTAPYVPFNDEGNEIIFPVHQIGNDPNTLNSDPITRHDDIAPRTNTFPKKLEFMLNAEAALDDVSEHFEVLAMGMPAQKVQWFGPELVSKQVKAKDIDLVLVQLSPEDNEQYDDYYWRPMTPEGIPVYDVDAEYAMKPWRQRVPDGAPKRLLDACFKDKLTKETSSNQLEFGSFEDLLYSGDSEILNDLKEMLGKPLGIMTQRVTDLKTSSGKSPMVAFIYIPDSDCRHCSEFENFWSDVCGRYGLTFISLTKPFEDLKISYFPTTEACCHQHYTAYGSELIATILRHELINKGWIPFTKDKK